jgi:adenosylhomocysteine nucleosidase
MILVATGLKREARILQGAAVQVVAGGGDRERLERALEDAAGRASGIISMGLCGALADDLQPGDWVIASRILTAGSVLKSDPDWTTSLAQRLPRARAGPILGSDVVIPDALAKRTAREVTGALAVDMESHIAAGVAARHGLPFAGARVVSDAADRALPKAAQAGMAADGSMDILAVLTALAADPRQLPALIRVGREAETAFRALSRGRDLLGPLLGRPDLGELPLDMA